MFNMNIKLKGLNIIDPFYDDINKIEFLKDDIHPNFLQDVFEFRETSIGILRGVSLLWRGSD